MPWGVGLFMPGGSLKLDGKPPTAGPGDCVGGLDGPRLGWGVGGPAREREKAFILAAMSGFMAAGPPLGATGAAGGRRAASRVPRGVDEALMFDMLEVMFRSELPRGASKRGRAGLVKGESVVSSGEVGGEGESSGLVGSSCESAMGTAEGCGHYARRGSRCEGGRDGTRWTGTAGKCRWPRVKASRRGRWWRCGAGDAADLCLHVRQAGTCTASSARV